ncbi:MAG: aspartate carbamoyltransferase regulatory subunit [Candidatus Diapherotrites archaeon]|nr:aspartate carbamoyltransferase regulatory subunit [Candidatus Diapherotrites archaeon]
MSSIGVKGVYVTPVQNGTALDHLNPGTSLKVLEVLKIKNARIGVAMNVESKKMGLKDIVFIEGVELSPEETEKIAFIGKGGTLNLIKNSVVVKKQELNYPQIASGIFKCLNPCCITNKELLETKFHIVSTSPLKAKCHYCEARMDENEITASIK